MPAAWHRSSRLGQALLGDLQLGNIWPPTAGAQEAVRVTQEYVELAANPNSDLRVTQDGLDLAYIPDTQSLRVTQDGIELTWLWSPHLRVTQDYIELLVAIAPPAPFSTPLYYAYIGALGLKPE